MNDPIQILIVDDHPIVRQGLAAVLVERNGMKVVGEAANGDDAVALARQLNPDIILMDLIMPHMSGVDATIQIRRDNSAARVLVLTSFGNEEMVGEALRAGAIGFLTKESQPDDLLLAIRSVYRGQLTFPHSLAHTLYAQESQDQAAKSSLTAREEDVLKAVSQGLSNQQIADQLNIGANTIRTHIGNLLHKLALSNRTELAIYALKRNPKHE